MTVTLVYKLLAIDLTGNSTLIQLARIQTQTHRAAHLNALLIGHDINNIILELAELRGISAVKSADMARELHNSHLHS